MGKLISNGGKYTGSQVLAFSMYLVDYRGDEPRGQARGGFDTYKEEFLTSAYAGFPLTLSDGWPGGQTMAICYYVPRRDREGLDKFVEGDNLIYTDAAKGGNFRAFIERLYQESEGRVPDFLILAPGPDRLYFTNDDISNWSGPPRSKPLFGWAWLLLASLAGGVGLVVVALLLLLVGRPCRLRNGWLLPLMGGLGLLLIVLALLGIPQLRV